MGIHRAVEEGGRCSGWAACSADVRARCRDRGDFHRGVEELLVASDVRERLSVGFRHVAREEKDF